VRREARTTIYGEIGTAFPLPAPDTAPAPSPMKVDPERLKSVLGITDVTFIPGRSSLAVVDATLSGYPPAFDAANREAMTQPGTYDYSCPIHPKMQGRIVVRRLGPDSVLERISLRGEPRSLT
jgi:hypothetical protein